MIPLSYLPLSLKKKTIKRTNKIKVRYQKAPLPGKKKTEIKQTHNKTKPEIHFLFGHYTWGWSLIWSMVDELCVIFCLLQSFSVLLYVQRSLDLEGGV